MKRILIEMDEIKNMVRQKILREGWKHELLPETGKCLL